MHAAPRPRACRIPHRIGRAYPRKVLQAISPSRYLCHQWNSRSEDPTASGPIASGLAAPGLLAFVVVSKFVEHMPLYRQQDELARANILISRSTLCGWLEQCAGLFKPLVELMHKEVLQSEVIQGDETPVPVLDRSRDSTRKGYI